MIGRWEIEFFGNDYDFEAYYDRTDHDMYEGYYKGMIDEDDYEDYFVFDLYRDSDYLAVLEKDWLDYEASLEAKPELASA